MNIKTGVSYVNRFVLQHPVMYYFFILPAYLPVRTLGESFPIYHIIMHDSYVRIDFFLYIMFQAGAAGVFISLSLMFINKKYYYDNGHILNFL